MRQTKKITLSAMLTALGTVLMVLGAFIDVIDLSVCALASLLVVFVYIEIGSPFTWLVWLCTSLLTFLLFPGKAIWIEYFAIFGIYPILKAYIERLPRFLWFLLKFVYIGAMLLLLTFLVELIIGVPLIVADSIWIKVGIYVIMYVAFFAYDVFITVCVRLYLERLRHRFKKMLK